jgi:hypothetical protein
MRPYVRATAAHNTVRINGADQSEMWKEFRVARRAYPERTSVDVVSDGALRIVGQHNGYRHPVATVSSACSTFSVSASKVETPKTY